MNAVMDRLPQRLPVRVYWEDTDASGVVYHAHYLRWFERGRTEWLRTLGHDQTRLAASLGIAFTVASLGIDYRRPARLDDELLVLTSLTERRGASLGFEQTLVKSDDPGLILAQARVRVACIDAVHFTPKRLPDLGI